MKIRTFLTGLTVCLLAVSFSACNKSTPNNPPDTTLPTTTTTATNVVTPVAGQTVVAATNAAESATAQFTTVVESAKSAIAAKNYQGALDALKKLSDVKLTDEQQKIVDDLKAQAQQLLSGTAADAAKNLLGK